jgi:lysophospholipid acyltransferase (LPLAT)-like uncharacterized protein
MADRWPWREKFFLDTLPLMASLLLRLLALTIRKKIFFPERAREFWDRGQNIIVVFWHQRLIMMPFLPWSGKAAMLISQHRDGEFIARTVKYFGVDSIRGSTTRGGFSGLRGMIRFYRQGGNLAITPDGPQGPKYLVQSGVIELARQVGAPILPVTYGASRKKDFNSWDRFILPLPFCKVAYLWGEPLFVPPDLDKESLESYRLLLQDRLRQVTEDADRMFARGS